MTDEKHIPEGGESEVHSNADDLNKSEKQLGTETRKLMEQQEHLLDKHIKNIADIHAVIIKIGMKLQAGREKYQFDNVGFNGWIQFNRLDSGRIYGGSTGQQERTAAMTIARLHEEGYAENAEAVPEKLDLAGCERVRPTDILKWARRQQPQLFPKIGKKPGKKKPAPKDKPAFETDDEIPDLANDPQDKDAAIIGAKLAAAKALFENATLCKLLHRVLTEVEGLPDALRTDIIEAWSTSPGTTPMTRTKTKTNEGDGWYPGEYTSDGDCWYNEPDGSDSDNGYCIEPVKNEKTGRITGYAIRDPKDEIIGKANTLNEAKRIAVEHMRDNPPDDEEDDDEAEAANNSVQEVASDPTPDDLPPAGKAALVWHHKDYEWTGLLGGKPKYQIKLGRRGNYVTYKYPDAAIGQVGRRIGTPCAARRGQDAR